MSLENSQYGIVLVTAASKTEAEAIALQLLQHKLAACISITSISSIYTWQNQIESAEEWQLIIKTDLSYFPQLASKIKELHSYETPEIIALPIIQASEDYLNWIKAVL
jgi:periplasmic divalent cation tolerance protein